MQKLNEHDKEFAEFACAVCHKKMRREHPKYIDCAWRGIDNEYCPDVMAALDWSGQMTAEPKEGAEDE